MIIQKMRVLPIDAFMEEIKFWMQKLISESFLKGCSMLTNFSMLIKKYLKPNQTKPPQKQNAKKVEIYLLGYSMWLFTHCNLIIFTSQLSFMKIPQQASPSSQLQKTLKYDKHIRALNGSILYHPQPLLVVLPGQMKLECTYSCSEL